MNRFLSLIAVVAACTLLATRVESAPQLPLRFDFGPPNQVLADGCIGLDGTAVYDPAKGYGWKEAWGLTAGENPACPDPILRDGIGGRTHLIDRDVTFLADVPDGAYKVTAWVGNTVPTEGRLGHCVATNGHVVLPPPGAGDWGKAERRELPAVVENGRLEVRFFIHGDGGANRMQLQGLAIAPVTDADEADRLRRNWEDAPEFGAAATAAPIMIAGKAYTEVGRRMERPLGRLPAEWQGKALLAFTRPNPGDILDYSIPRLDELRSDFAVFATPDDDQPISFGLHAVRELKDIRVHCSDFTCGDATLASWNAELFTVTCLPKAPSISRGSACKIAPALLEKNFPFDLAAGRTQPLFIRFRIPAGQKPGLYRAALRISPRDEAPQALDLTLRVLPLELPRQTGKSWHLFSDSDRWHQMTRTAMKTEIEDLVRHGINSIAVGVPPVGAHFVEYGSKIVDADYGRVGEGLTYAAQLGMDGPALIGATVSIVGRMRGWNVGTRNGAEKELVPSPEGRALRLRHPAATATSDVGTACGGIAPPGEPVRFEVYYRLTGAVSATATASFMKSYKRDPVPDNAVTLTLAPTGDAWRSVSGVAVCPTFAPYVAVSIRASNGPGELFLEHARVLGPDGTVCLNSNAGFERDLPPADLNQPWDDAFMKEYASAIAALGKAVRRYGFEPWIEGTDEAHTSPRELQEMKGARLSGLTTWCNTYPATADAMGPDLDGLCYYAQMLGSEEECARLLAQKRARKQKLYYIAGGTYDGQDFDTMPNRYHVGFFFWKNGLDGTGIWTFQRPVMDPYNDFDGGYKDCCLVYPPRQPGGAAIPTLGWEGIREGWKDFRYAYALQQAIAAARQAGRTADADRGELVATFIRQTVPWYDRLADSAFDNVAADRLRWLAAWAAMGVHDGTLIATTEARVAPPPATLRIACPEQGTERPLTPVICPPVATAPRLDGTLADPIWQQAYRVESFSLHTSPGVPPTQKTEVFLCHDRENLYLGVRCQEQAMAELKAAATTEDGPVFTDDSIEIFLDTDNDEFTFHQLAFNANGIRFDQYGEGAYDYGFNIFAAEIGGKQVRNVGWNGAWTVKTSRHADCWEATVALPFATFGRASDLWGILIGRNRRATERQETSSWPAIGFFHQPAKFAKLLLGGARVGDARITQLEYDRPRFGLCTARLTVDGAGAGVLRGRADLLADKDVALGTGAASPAGEGKLQYPYRLDAAARRIVLTLEDGAGTLLSRCALPCTLAPPIRSHLPGAVLLQGDRDGRLDLDLAISTAERARSTLTCRLLTADGKELATQSAPAAGDQATVRFTLDGQPVGLYRLALALADDAQTKPQTLDLPILFAPAAF